MRHYEVVFLVHPDQSEQVGGMSGIELTRRALAMDPALRIVVASGYAFEREPGMEARVGVLIKPYDLNKIRQALADVQR